MTRRALTAALTLAALAIGAPPAAQASYAPQLSVTLQPATAHTAAGATTTTTQPPGETANKTIRVHYPPQFGFNPGFDVMGCPPSAESADSCPPESQIGTASAETSLGSFSGPVYFTPDFRLLIYLRSLDGLLNQKVVGYFQVTADGGVDAVVDNLPNFSATASTVTLQSGARSPLLTPRACGDYTIVGHFTSQNGEEATSASTVHITGCDSQPTIDSLSLTPATLTSPGAPNASPPAATLNWDLSDSGATTTIELQRVQTTNGLQTRQLLWTKTASANKGPNSMPFVAALNGLPLPPGDYRFALSVTSTAGVPSDSSNITFVIGGSRAGRCKGRASGPRRSRHRRAGGRCAGRGRS